ncbi:UNVERIFIED_CONTAM: non-heme chloroperoxidase [Williamsia faeni]
MSGGQSLLQAPQFAVRHTVVDRPGGASIAVYEYGPADGDPVVLVHGFAVSARYWNPQINGLAGRFRVITYDQRGHGRSELGSETTVNEHLGQDLSAVLEHTVADGRPAVVVGHSMGGMSVMSWAAQYPSEVGRYARSIVLAGTSATSPVTKRPVRLGKPVSVVRRVQYETAWLAFTAIHWPGGDLLMRSGMMAAGMVFPGTGRAQLIFLDTILRDTDWRTREKVGRSLEGLSVARGLSAMDVPVAVLVGSRDRLTPPRLAIRVADALRYTGSLERFETWRDATHLLNWEQPHRFNAVIADLSAAGH